MDNLEQERRSRDKAITRVGALSVILLIFAISFISGIAIGHVHYGASLSSETTTKSTSTTSYSVGWNFYVAVSYQNKWVLSYQGFASSNLYEPTNHGEFNGTGSMIRAIGVNGTLTNGMSLCILAQKEDNSSLPLAATLYVDPPSPGGVNYHGNTTRPYGSVSLCIDIGPY